MTTAQSDDTSEPTPTSNDEPEMYWTFHAKDRLSWERSHHRWSAEELDKIKQRAEQIARQRDDPGARVVTSFAVDAAIDELVHAPHSR